MYFAFVLLLLWNFDSFFICCTTNFCSCNLLMFAIYNNFSLQLIDKELPWEVKITNTTKEKGSRKSSLNKIKHFVNANFSFTYNILTKFISLIISDFYFIFWTSMLLSVMKLTGCWGALCFCDQTCIILKEALSVIFWMKIQN